MLSQKGFMHVRFGTVSVWVFDDKWQSLYKLDFVFSGANVLVGPPKQQQHSLGRTSRELILKKGKDIGFPLFMPFQFSARLLSRKP